MKSNIVICDSNIEQEVLELNLVLADELILYTRIRNYYTRSVEDNMDYDLQRFYKNKYEILNQIIDNITARVHALGHYTQIRLDDYINLSNLIESEETEPKNNVISQLRDLRADNQKAIYNLHVLLAKLSEEATDIGISDFVQEILGYHEKISSFLQFQLLKRKVLYVNDANLIWNCVNF